MGVAVDLSSVSTTLHHGVAHQLALPAFNSFTTSSPRAFHTVACNQEA